MEITTTVYLHLPSASASAVGKLRDGTADGCAESGKGFETEVRGNLPKEEAKAADGADGATVTTRGDDKVAELLACLRRVKSRKETNAEIASLVETTNAGKSAAQLLARYEGREGELIGYLRRLRSEQLAERVSSLVATVKPGKSAEELRDEYVGREDELVKYLEKMKARKERKRAAARRREAEIRSLAASVNTGGRGADELLAAYRGREGELTKLLESLKLAKEGA